MRSGTRIALMAVMAAAASFAIRAADGPQSQSGDVQLLIADEFFNEGRYSLGVNASSFGVRRYFMDESALSFNVDISGAPGTQWPELRQGPIRPRLDWKIEKLD